MNNVCLAGNLTKDVELRTTQGGKSVANFSLAINEGKDRTEFVNCIAWEKTGELINEYCRKGDRVSCVGRLQTRKWEKDGETRYATEVVVSSFDFPPKNSRSSTGQEHDTSNVGVAGSSPAASANDFEDEIPIF